MIDTELATPVSSRPSKVGRWLALVGGVVNSIAFVVTYTVVGALRPGYSPVHQSISDLGVGWNGPVMDTIAAAHGLLLIVFAAGFAMVMQPVLGPGWRRWATALLTLRGLAGVITALFTDAAATVAIHSSATIVALLAMVSSFLVIGLGLSRSARWRRYGIYSLAATAATVLLVAVMFWLFNPRSPAAHTHLGGLAERLVSIETLAWYVVFGWRLFREGRPVQRPQTAATAR
jgi:hypothetical membrane protein